MESRERLLRFFNDQDIDRLPIWLLFPHHPLGSYCDVWNLPIYQPVIRRIQAGDCDSFDRRGCARNVLYTACEDLSIRPIETGDPTLSRVMELRYQDFSLRSFVERGKNRTRVKFMVDDPQQLRKLMEVPYVPVRPDLARLREERAEFAGRGLFMLDLGDPLTSPYNLMSAEDFAITSITEPDLLKEFLDVISERVLDLYRYFLENDAADCYFIVGSEFAGPPLISPDNFRILSERYVKSICDLIRSYGKISIVHYHGFLKAVLPHFKKIGMDGLHTIEAPPVGNCTLREARAGLGCHPALIGNVQYDDLVRLSPDEIEAQVHDAVNQAGDGKLILSPTAGPYEANPSPQLIENYLRFIDAGLQYGKK